MTERQQPIAISPSAPVEKVRVIQLRYQPFFNFRLLYVVGHVKNFWKEKKF